MLGFRSLSCLPILTVLCLSNRNSTPEINLNLYLTNSNIPGLLEITEMGMSRRYFELRDKCIVMDERRSRIPNPLQNVQTLRKSFTAGFTAIKKRTFFAASLREGVKKSIFYGTCLLSSAPPPLNPFRRQKRRFFLYKLNILNLNSDRGDNTEKWF